MKPASGNYHTIGIMSGTSLDGMDIACCEFSFSGKQWTYQIPFAQTYPYSDAWREKLSEARTLSGQALVQLSKDWARLAAGFVKDTILQCGLNPEFIASHGHTVFHQPEKKLTLQIGDGAILSALTKLRVVCDFRSQDVELGGQGAPLVPAGDRHLFGEYSYCLNLGGFANISYEHHSQRIAFDVCPCNVVLNRFSEKINLPFDHNGMIAGSGNLIPEVLELLNSLSYYKQPGPKSLGIEWVESEIIPLLSGQYAVKDILRTMTEHIAMQVAVCSRQAGQGKMLVTGGGAYHDFLLNRIRNLSTAEIVIPDQKTIDYKEALVFAFLGLLRIRNEVNVYASVTGAGRDSISGCLYG